MDQRISDAAPTIGEAVRDPGSFRDPSGFVCSLDGEIYRAIDAEFARTFNQLSTQGVLGAMTDMGQVIPTGMVDRNDPAYSTLHSSTGGFQDFLHHKRVPVISYPYEWSPSMLADAGRCYLDIERSLVKEGFTLKDASAFNIQFVGGRPTLIDIPSMQPTRRRDVWPALNQFHRMFLYPLLLSAARKCSVREYFLGSIDGLELDDVVHRFGVAGALRPGLLLDLTLPFLLGKLASGSGEGLRASLEGKKDNPTALLWNIDRLKRKLSAAAKPMRRGHWTEYARDNSYSGEDSERKRRFVTSFIERHRPRRVLDIGCNTGEITDIATGSGASVVAVDSDEACVDALYRRVRSSGDDVLPLVIDIANPTPATGFRNEERLSFLQRTRFDAVFALALVHHLLITSRLPLESICDLFADLTSEFAVVEFVGPGDDMFKSLVSTGENLYEHLTEEVFLRTFNRRFEAIDTCPCGDHRLIVVFRKRT